jgi:hypothetical protein
MESIKAKANVKSGDSQETSTVADRPAGGTHAWDKPMSKTDSAPKISADVQSAKLKQLLGQIKTN